MIQYLYSEIPVDWDETRADEYFHWTREVVDALPWVNEPLKLAWDKVIHKY